MGTSFLLIKSTVTNVGTVSAYAAIWSKCDRRCEAGAALVKGFEFLIHSVRDSIWRQPAATLEPGCFIAANASTLPANRAVGSLLSCFG